MVIRRVVLSCPLVVLVVIVPLLRSGRGGGGGLHRVPESPVEPLQHRLDGRGPAQTDENDAGPGRGRRPLRQVPPEARDEAGLADARSATDGQKAVPPPHDEVHDLGQLPRPADKRLLVRRPDEGEPGARGRIDPRAWLP